jgi:AhpC/TSA family protein
MKFITIVIALVLTSLSSFVNAQRVSDFALLDHNGKFHQLSYFGDHKAVVITAQSSASAVIKSHLDGLHELQAQFADQGVVFYMLNSAPEDTRETILAHTGAHSYQIPVLVDEAQLVAETLGIRNIGEVLIIDPQNMTLIHKGAIEATEALAKTLDIMLAGEPVSMQGPTTKGELISFTSRELDSAQQVSYTRDIVPILMDNCVQCHHDGGIGPWSMSSHNMIRGWSAMMREVVLTRRMPPGQIDPHVGKPIADIAGLTTRELQQLVHWIDAGAPIDGDTDPLTMLTIDNPKFTLGEPDLVFKVPAQTIPATGVIDYRYVPVELNLDRDVWVRAMEFVPGDREVLHHVIAYVSSPADKTVRGRETGAARGESVGGFAPGRQPDAFRDNSGRLLTKGSNLLLQMHYTTSGKETVDETEVGLYIYDEPPTYVMSGGVAGQRRFLIPPHAKEHPIVGVQEIERDAYLYDMTPHMHFRGKYMSYSAEYPDGTTELLLSVPKYNFNWQFNYALKEPLFLPAGSKIVARGAMDNSDRNPSNPDPSKPVHFGLQTKHEMFFGFTTLRYVGDTPATVMSDTKTAGNAGSTGGQ